MKGFTLIELLVVVLIIGILSAIALPQYRNSIEKSRAAEMMIWLSNAKKAMDAYYADRGDMPETQINFAKDDYTGIDLNLGQVVSGSGEVYNKYFTAAAQCGNTSCFVNIYRNSQNPDIAGDIWYLNATYYPDSGTWANQTFYCNSASAKAVATYFKSEGFTLSGC